MLKLLIVKKLFLIWASLLGSDEWVIREYAESLLKQLNNKYDFRSEVKALKKSKDLEVRRRAQRIENFYYPERTSIPLFHCYDGRKETLWVELFTQNFWMGYDYKENYGRIVWQSSLSDEERRNLTRELIKDWISKGITLTEINKKLDIMEENESKEKFFNTSKEEDK